MAWTTNLELMMAGGGKLVMWLVFLLAAGIQGYVETEEFISDLDRPGEWQFIYYITRSLLLVCLPLWDI